MIQTHSTFSSQFHIGAWQLIAAALILLTMPVNYRGGAELPHPHAFFQFWSSGDKDAFDHHGRRLSEPLRERSSEPVGFTLAGARGSEQSSSMNSIEPRPDTPLLSEMNWPGERADALALALIASLIGAAVTVRALRVEAPWSIPDGRQPSPETPPPR
jgi:hypothetical protein